jgi:hypothetical protein
MRKTAPCRHNLVRGDVNTLMNSLFIDDETPWNGNQLGTRCPKRQHVSMCRCLEAITMMTSGNSTQLASQATVVAGSCTQQCTVKVPQCQVLLGKYLPSGAHTRVG